MTYTFDTGLDGAAVSGSAAHRVSGGVNDTGFVSITTAENSLQGGLTLPDFDAGGPAGSFNIAFSLLIGGPNLPADGFSFNIVPAGDPVLGQTIGEDGPGRGLTVSFDTWDNYDNGTGPDAVVSAPVLQVFYNGVSLGNRQSVGRRDGNPPREPTSPIYTYSGPNGQVQFDVRTGTAWEPVRIMYTAQPNGTGLLNVDYKGVRMFENIAVNMPAGRYRIMMGARTGGANDNHWVDEFVISTAAPAFHRVTRTNPTANGSIFGTSNLEVDIADGTNGALVNSSVSATLNGVAVPAANITFAKNGAVTTITIDPPGDLPRSSQQTLVLTYGNGVGAETSTLTLPFLVSPVTADTLFIETEDLDYGAGQFVAESQSPTYPGGGYADIVSQPLHQADYNGNTSTDPNVVGTNFYRTGETPNIGMTETGDRNRLPGFDRTVDFKVGWNDGGEWMNYTRDFNGGNYEVWGRLASGGAAINSTLSLVQDNQVEVQVVGEIGSFTNPSTGGWDNWVMVPLRDKAGAVANVVIKGRQTVRYTSVAGGNNDNNYLAFVPVAASVQPAIVTLTPNNGVAGSGTVTFNATIVEQSAVIDPASVSLSIGATTIATGTAVKGGQVITISGTFDNFGYFNTRTGTVRYNDGTARSVDFTLTSGGGVTYKRFLGITGGAWQEVVNHAKYQNNAPDLVKEIPRFEHNDTSAPIAAGGDGIAIQDFGGQLLAYFRPPATGPYQFNLSADDGAALWLSTDESPSRKVLIAQQPAWSGYRAFNTQTDQGAGSTPAARVSPMINLEAGRRYYIEAIYHEGAGGDNIAVTYRTSTTTPWVNGVPGLSEVEPFQGADFDVLPQAVNTFVGRRVSFTGHLQAAAGGTITYQWLRGGVAIDGETTGTYTIPAVAIGDDGAMISLRASLNGIDYTSPAVRLTVNADSVAPTIASVRTRNFHELAVVFSEEVAAVTVDNFTINNGVTVTSVEFDAGFPRHALLVTSGLTENTTYTVTPTNVQDLAGNTATGSANVTPVFSPRFAEVEYFRNIGGGTIPDLTGHAKYAQAPDEVVYNSTFEAGSGSAAGIWDNYGASIHGFFVPPRDGGVIFYMSSDDHGQLWLSTDANPANKVMIAREPAWSNPREWVISSNAGSRPFRENISGVIEVTAGTRYYIELLFKEGGGGDNGGATYMYGDQTDDPANGSPALRGTDMGVVVNGAGRSITFTTPVTNPNPPTVEGNSANLSGVVAVNPEGSTVGYQWYIKRPGEADFTEIPNATTSMLNTGTLLRADNGTMYRLLAFTLGATATSEATITVEPDTVAPTPTAASALRAGDNADVGIIFNEPVDPASAANPANYTVSAGQVLSAQYFPQDNGVAVRVSGLTVGQSYTVTVRGVQDRYGNAVAASGVALPFRLGPMNWVQVGSGELGLPYGVVAVGANGFDAISGGIGQWSNYDESTFIYEPISGNFDKKVRVSFQESSSQWARAGLIVRETLDAGKARLLPGEDPVANGFSRYQKVHVNPVVTAMGTAGNNAHELNRRLVVGAPPEQTTSAPTANNAAPPYPNAWVRLKREGDVLTMYRNDTGLDPWIQLGTTTLPGLAATVFVGPDYAPEVGNIPAGPLRRSYMAQFRGYSDTFDTPPAEPIIAYVKTATGIQLSWANDPTLKLYRSDRVDGGWTEVVGATNPYDVVIPSGTSAAFYRVSR